MSLGSLINSVVTRIAVECKSLRSAIASKADDSAVVHNSGNETVGGIKTFSAAPQVPVGSLLANPVRRDDARLTDARTPLAHASSHAPGGSDPLTGYVPSSQVGAASGVASLDSGGKIPQAQLPAVALTEFLGAVASQTAMLALSGQRGDWCTRTDLGTDWQLIAEPSSTLANWRQMTYPASPVSSVNGRTGAVTGLAEQSAVDSAIAGRQPLDADLTTIAGLSPTNGQLLRRVSGAWAASALTASDVGALAASSNLSDLASASSARTNLGLGAAATMAVGTTSTTVASGDRGVPAGGSAGQVLTKASATNYDDAWTDLYGPIFATNQAVSQNTPNNTLTKITWTTEDLDTHNAHSPTTNPSRFTCPAGWAGWYRVSALIVTNGSTGARTLSLMKNNVEIAAGDLRAATSLGGGVNRIPFPAKLVQLAVNDYLEIAVWVEQVASGTPATIVAPPSVSWILIEFVRP